MNWFLLVYLEVGFRGSPWSFAISYTAMPLILIAYMLVRREQFQHTWSSFGSVQFAQISELIPFVKLGAPGILAVCGEWYGFLCLCLFVKLFATYKRWSRMVSEIYLMIVYFGTLMAAVISV